MRMEKCCHLAELLLWRDRNRIFLFLIGVNGPFFKAQKAVNPTFTFEEPPPLSGRLSQHCNFHCSTAHQLHQPSVCHPVYGRPQQPQLSSQHRWKEGASLPGRRGHEWPAGIELGTDWTLPTLPRPAQPSAELTRSLILCLYQLKKKSKKKKSNKTRTLYKMYKMKDYFFKWLQYYILFFDREKILWWWKGTIL